MKNLILVVGLCAFFLVASKAKACDVFGFGCGVVQQQSFAVQSFAFAHPQVAVVHPRVQVLAVPQVVAVQQQPQVEVNINQARRRRGPLGILGGWRGPAAQRTVVRVRSR